MKNKILLLLFFFWCITFNIKAQNQQIELLESPPPAEWLNWFNAEVE
jgi:hypothetical protein